MPVWKPVEDETWPTPYFMFGSHVRRVVWAGAAPPARPGAIRRVRRPRRPAGRRFGTNLNSLSPVRLCRNYVPSNGSGLACSALLGPARHQMSADGPRPRGFWPGSGRSNGPASVSGSPAAPRPCGRAAFLAHLARPRPCRSRGCYRQAHGDTHPPLMTSFHLRRAR